MLANQLSIYKETYKLVKLLVVQVSKMPRLHKFTLGEKILNTAYSLFSHIQLANMYKEERNEHLKMFIVEFETLICEHDFLYYPYKIKLILLLILSLY